MVIFFKNWGGGGGGVASYLLCAMSIAWASHIWHLTTLFGAQGDSQRAGNQNPPVDYARIFQTRELHLPQLF